MQCLLPRADRDACKVADQLGHQPGESQRHLKSLLLFLLPYWIGRLTIYWRWQILEAGQRGADSNQQSGAVRHWPGQCGKSSTQRGFHHSGDGDGDDPLEHARWQILNFLHPWFSFDHSPGGAAWSEVWGAILGLREAEPGEQRGLSALPLHTVLRHWEWKAGLQDLAGMRACRDKMISLILLFIILISQVFSRQAVQMDALISAFVDEIKQVSFYRVDVLTD